MNRFQEALAAYEVATRLSPDDAPTWVNKGICFAEQKLFAKAMPCFERASKLGHPGGVSLIAACNRAMGQG